MLSVPFANAHDVSVAVGALTVSVSCVPPVTFAGNAVVPFVRAGRVLVPSDTATVPEGRPEMSTETVKVGEAASLPASRLPLDEPPELPEEPLDAPEPELPEELLDVPEPELPEELLDVPEPELLALAPPSRPASAPVATGW
jgi:hypothetical protein